MEVSGQLHATATLTPREEPRGHVEDEAGRAPEPAWKFQRREKELLFLSGFEPLHCPPLSLVTTLTLPRLPPK